MTTDPLQPLIDALRSAWPQADGTSLALAADQLLRTRSATVGDSTASLTFGQGNDLRGATVTIGPIAGGNITQITINVPQPINPQAAILQHLLYHHESATIFANRLDSFVGREAEIAEIRQRIAQVMPTGGYVTITAQAGEGKSSVIARMVSQDGPDQTAFHFIALTPGREYQLSLLRPIVARLILKHGLPTTYFPGESYPAMRDYFHSVVRQLSERGVREVIYIDGLDQLDPEPGGTRDLSFLPTSPPHGIVLVLGTRPDDTLQPLEGKKTQIEYRLPHLSYPDFQQLVAQRSVITPAAQRLYTALQGNAFYLALVVQELKAGPIADLDALIRQISDNPDNLFGLTIERLQRDEKQWETVLEPVLILLLVAQEPLDRATVRSLLAVSDVRLRRGLGQLGGLVAQDGNGGYFLYHLKVREYLAEDEKQPNTPFVVSHEQIIAWHATLAQWCVGDSQDIKRIWEEATGLKQIRRWYARHHYVTHLVLGQRWDTLQQVIDEGVYGRNKQQFDPSTHLYAQDLERALRYASERYDLIRLWRWSLLRTSLSSLMDQWPDDLFIALVHLGRGAEALSRLELLSDITRRFKVLCVLAPLLPRKDTEDVWYRLQVMAELIGDDYGRRRVKHALMRIVSENVNDVCQWAGLLCNAIESKPELPHKQRRYQDGLSKLARTLSHTASHAEVIEDFLHWILPIGLHSGADAPEYERAYVLRDASMILVRMGLWNNAYATIELIHEPRARTEALSTLALAQAAAGDATARVTFAQARHVAEHIFSAIYDEEWRAKTLRDLAEALAQAEFWDEADATIECIAEGRHRARALIALGVAQAKAGREVAVATFARARTSALLDERANNTLDHLVQAQIQFAFWDEALITIQAIGRDGGRTYVKALAAFVVAQARVGCKEVSRLFDLAAKAVREKHGLQFSKGVYGDLAMALGQAGFWRESWSVVESTPISVDRVRLQATLALSQAQANHPDAAMSFTMTRKLAEGLKGLVPRIKALTTLAVSQAQVDSLGAVTTLACAGRATEGINNSVDRIEALTIVAAAQAQVNHPDAATSFALARMVAKDVGTTNGTNGYYIAIRNLSIALAQVGYWSEARAIIEGITLKEERARALTALAEVQAKAHHPEAMTTFALARVVAESAPVNSWDGPQDRIRRELVLAMARVGFWSEAHAVIEGIILKEERARALTGLGLAQAWADHPAAATTFALAHRATEGTGGYRTELLDDLLMALARVEFWDLAGSMIKMGKISAKVRRTHCETLIRSGNTEEIQQQIIAAWRLPLTTADLLEMAEVAVPFVPYNPKLGVAMIESLIWIDAQLQID